MYSAHMKKGRKKLFYYQVKANRKVVTGLGIGNPLENLLLPRFEKFINLSAGDSAIYHASFFLLSVLYIVYFRSYKKDNNNNKCTSKGNISLKYTIFIEIALAKDLKPLITILSSYYTH